VYIFLKQRGSSDFPSTVSTSIIVERKQHSIPPFGTFLPVAGQAFQCQHFLWETAGTGPSCL